jgi:MFS family permease
MTTSRADSPFAWARLVAALLVGAIGGVGMWSVAVVLPAVQAEFGVARGAASFPYAMTMLGLAAGGLLYGRLMDRRGIRLVLALGAVMLAAGYWAASQAATLWQFIAVHGVAIGALGAAATFGPLVADVSLWFERRRGLAVALCASGNYLAGAIWPPLVQRGVELYGWRTTYQLIAVACLVLMLPLIAMFRRPPPAAAMVAGVGVGNGGIGSVNPRALQGLLMLAGIACCVGMSMPQVHIVAYCGDLGYGVRAGAEMLSLMLACGIVSRLLSGWICDHIGGVATLLLGSTLQCLVLVAYLPFDSLTSLYVVSALFGLVQGGIVPSYAIVAREVFPPAEAGTRVSAVLMSTIVGMALGGWLSGLIYDATGSYQAAFLHGIGWNILNILIALWLFSRRHRGDAPRPVPA